MVDAGLGYHGVQPRPTDGSCGKGGGAVAVVERGRVGGRTGAVAMGPGGAARVAEVAIAVDMFCCL